MPAFGCAWMRFRHAIFRSRPFPFFAHAPPSTNIISCSLVDWFICPSNGPAAAWIAYEWHSTRRLCAWRRPR